MNFGQTMLAVFEPLPQWVNFLAVAGGMLLGSLGVLVWYLAFRKKRKRKYRQHHHEKHQLNPTLAQSGGLPPKREDEKPSGEIPPP